MNGPKGRSQVWSRGALGTAEPALRTIVVGSRNSSLVVESGPLATVVPAAIVGGSPGVTPLEPVPSEGVTLSRVAPFGNSSRVGPVTDTTFAG